MGGLPVDRRNGKRPAGLLDPGIMVKSVRLWLFWYYEGRTVTDPRFVLWVLTGFNLGNRVATWIDKVLWPVARRFQGRYYRD